MLAALLHSIWQYQVFKSVVFRGGMAFLTAYFLIVWLMPYVIRAFRKKGITSDFITAPADLKPYTGAPPIMGGGVLIIGIFFWCNSLVQSEPIRCGSDVDNAFFRYYRCS